ncbi:MAG: MBL fold metallo-hydrolase [Parachlamydia sp.]|nr:MAG: MBL fold metallo-hydrolase [Parachlamydia sp.]
MVVKLSLHAAGSCFQLEKLVLQGGRLKNIRFPAMFALIKHPSEGYILFDTGYSSHVLAETKRFPTSLYAKIIPIVFEEQDSAANQLKALGISPESIKKIILSHFHTDHIGGLRDFPNAEFIFTASAGNTIQELSGFKALTAAFIPELLPENFWQRTRQLDDSKLAPDPLNYPGFERGYDLLGDGSLVAVNLPGHAIGQIGVFVLTQERSVLLAADACWVSRAFRELIYPNPLARMFIADNKAFNASLQKLHRLHCLRPDILIIPTHCEEALCSLS